MKAIHGAGSFGVSSPLIAFDVERGEYLFHGVGSTVVAPADPPSATRPARRLFSRFGTAVAPLAVAAAFASPASEGMLRRRISAVRGSQTAVGDIHWFLDAWSYSEEQATPQQLMLIRTLLALETSEGLTLDLTE